MSLASVFEAEVRSKIGQVAENLVPRERPTYDTLRRLFPPTKTKTRNARIAEAAGYRGGPKGSRAYVERRTFMRSLQRYENRRAGTGRQSRSPNLTRGSELERIARDEQRRRTIPRDAQAVLRAMARRGTTTYYVHVKFEYSSPKNPQRQREIEVSVFTHPEVYADVGWDTTKSWAELAQLYLEAWAIAYGMAGELVAAGVDDDNPVLLFELGRGEGVLYDFT